MSASASIIESKAARQNAPLPLCTDLDGTLVRTNLVYECALACVRARPWLLLLLPFWALRGHAFLWAKLARFTGAIDASKLPYRPQVLELLAREKARGRDIILVTGTHRRFAEAVAGYLGCFSEVIATEGRTHCTGRRKAMILVRRFGAFGFDYAADSANDLLPWCASRLAVLVNAPGRTARKLGAKGVATTALDTQEPSALRALFQAIRPHQAVKNLLVFAPILLSHNWNQWSAVRNGALVFAAFCAASFAGYLLNDLVDLEADRSHPRKRRRPIASGTLSLPAAGFACVILMLVAGALSYTVSLGTLVMTAGYLVSTLAYSFWLKRVLAVDVVLLAGLYCYRVLAGGVATAITISPWTLAFSLFVFVSLALMKRFAELETASPGEVAQYRRRGYADSDKLLLAALGSAAAMMSVLVIALYVNSEDVRLLYSRPKLLWLQCPIVLLWTMRLWLIAGRGRMDEDPVLYAVKDVWTYTIAAAAVAVAVVAI